MNNLKKPRVIALMIAIAMAGLAKVSGLPQLFFALKWSMDMGSVAAALLMITIIGLLIFAVYPRRSNLHFIWLLPTVGLAGFSFQERTIALVDSGVADLLIKSPIQPLLYLCLTVGASMLLASDKKTGLVSFLAIQIALFPLAMQAMHLPYIHMIRPG